jgi:hypothetical protein
VLPKITSLELLGSSLSYVGAFKFSDAVLRMSWPYNYSTDVIDDDLGDGRFRAE